MTVLLKYLLRCFIVLLVLLLNLGCENEREEARLSSPNGELEVILSTDDQGVAHYSLYFKDSLVVAPSAIGFEFKDQSPFSANVEIDEVSYDEFSEEWTMPWGEQDTVRNHYKEMRVILEEDGEIERELAIVFRAFDDGVGFRYEFPEWEGVDSLLITDENTNFNFTGDHQTWWIPGDWDIYEHLYSQTRISGINATDKRYDLNLNATYIPENAVNTPVTFRTDDGLHISVHEADLTNYAGMTLKVDSTRAHSFVSELVGSDRLGGKAIIDLPFNTPWRTILVTESAAELVESTTILNLNEPNAIGDVSYFTPMKYAGIWWEMHIGKSTWDMEGSQNMSSHTTGEAAVSNHGATTENAKRYIDFAAANNIKGLLVEGWNTGWDKWINTEDREGVFDFMTPYPDYDFEEVMQYAEDKGVEVIMHHETSAAPRTYEKQMKEAYQFMKDNNINSVKTGYVGKIIPKGEYHHGQWMVNHYQKVLDEAAKMKIAVNAHEPIKDTGKRRTYPNAISREGLRGQEFNAWASDGGNPPDHLPTVVFTRMLSGPIDFTPGIFNIKFDAYKKENQVNTTLAQQLALYVVLYSPIQMVADLPEHYMKDGAYHPALQFIRDVGVDWSESRVINGEVGEFVTIARREKGTQRWFVGGITDENAREMNIALDFLAPGKTYTANLYRDAEDAHWDNKPEAIEIESMEVKQGDDITVKLAPGGGFALSLIPSE